MKRYTRLFLVFILLCSMFSGCGSNENTPEKIELSDETSDKHVGDVSERISGAIDICIAAIKKSADSIDTSDVDIAEKSEEEPENNTEDYGHEPGTYGECRRCGSAPIYLYNFGVCENCYEPTLADMYGRCQRCGVGLQGGEAEYGRCTSCMNICDYCGGSLDGGSPVEWCCYSCYADNFVTCAVCGSSDNVDMSTGLCYNCMGGHDAIYVTCPNCGADYRKSAGPGNCFQCGEYVTW